MRMRAMDGAVAVGLVVGLAWAWPAEDETVAIAEPPPERPERAVREREPLPTRKAPDRHLVRASERLVLPDSHGDADDDLRARVHFVLEAADGSAASAGIVYSPDCGVNQPIPGSEATLHLPAATCTFYGRRRSGLLFHETEATVATLSPGDDWELVLTFPPGETGGLGGSLSRHPAGVRLSFVLPGMGADQAGLQAGDVIVSVEGESVKGLPLDEVVRRLTGEVGSLVDVEIWDPGAPHAGLMPARVKRTFLPE